jgi:hypothetical protein
MPSKAITKEVLFIVLTVVITILITVLATVSGAGFDLSRVSQKETLTNVLLNTSITLLTLVAAIPYGKVATMCKKIGNDLGRYLTSFSKFNDICKKIAYKLNLFDQWHTAKYEKEVLDKQKRYLSDKGIKQVELILKLDRSQIQSLTEAREFVIDNKTVYINSLTTEQIKACLKVADGKITLHKLPNNYFLSIDGKSSSSFYEQAFYEKRLQTWYAFHSVMSKVLFGVVISCVFTSLILDTIVFDSNTLLKIFINLSARILTIVLNLFNGFSIGQELVYKKCYYIDGKTQILTEFDEDKNFVYKDPQELAKQEFLERSVASETEDKKQDNVLD